MSTILPNVNYLIVKENDFTDFGAEEILERVPMEVLSHVFTFLPAEDLGKANVTCRKWKELSADILIDKMMDKCFQRLSDAVNRTNT